MYGLLFRGVGIGIVRVMIKLFGIYLHVFGLRVSDEWLMLRLRLWLD